MPSYLEIQEQIKALQKQAENIKKAETAAVISEIKAKIAQYEISAKDLGFSETTGHAKKQKSGRQSVAAKYKGPHGETWSGRGKQPRWIMAAIAAGKSLNDFLI